MKNKYFSDDDFFYEGTDIPRNKLNIKDRQLLDEIEKEKYIQLYEKYIEKIPEVINKEYVKELHHFFFNVLYDWAGKIRKVKMSKGKIIFCHPLYIEKELNAWSNNYGYLSNIKKYNKEEFVRYLAEMKTEFLIIHPFREGNGRLIRFISDSITFYMGYDLIWRHYEFTEAHKQKYFYAMERALLNKDYTDITDIIKENLILL